MGGEKKDAYMFMINFMLSNIPLPRPESVLIFTGAVSLPSKW